MRKCRCCLLEARFFCLILLLFFADVVCLGQGSDIKEYSDIFESKWDEYLHALGNVEGSIQYTYTRNGKREEMFVNCLVAAYPLFADIRGAFESPIDVTATGKRYRFSLRRSVPADGWRIDDISGDSTEFSNKDIPWSFPEHFVTPSSRTINPNGYTIFNTIGVGLFGIDSDPNLPFMFASEWIHVHDCFLEKKGNEERLFVSFDYKRKNYFLHGEVFLTTDFFLVTEGKFHVENLSGTRDVQVKVDYDIVKYRVPLPKNYYKKETYKMIVDEQHYEGVFETEQKFDLKETESESFKYFTLSGYGLPEPDFGERPIGWFRYTLMAAGGLLIVFALWRMYRERKERRQ